MYWECHITIGVSPLGSRALAEALGWKYSCIDNDPDLGEGFKEYATRHASTAVPFQDVVDALNRTSAIFKDMGFKVLRQKVELVMYDTKGKEKT
jgi:hypothetical protein